MRGRLLIIGLVLLVPFIGKGQTFLFSQYVVDATAFNPAYAGSQGALTFTTQARFQWNGLQGAPRYGVFSVHSPLTKKGLAAGIRLGSDQLGIFNQQQLSPSLAYRFVVGEKTTLSFGLQGHALWLNANADKLSLHHPNDPTFTDIPRSFSFAYGAGAFLASDKAYVGVAIPDILPPAADSATSIMQRQRAYLVHAGFVVPLGKKVQLKPNTLLKYAEATGLYVDVNLNVLLYDALWLGASYRLNQQVGALAQLQLTPQLAIGYSYETPVNATAGLPFTTHEALVQYRLYFKRSEVKSPRYF